MKHVLTFIPLLLALIYIQPALGEEPFIIVVNNPSSATFVNEDDDPFLAPINNGSLESDPFAENQVIIPFAVPIDTGISNTEPTETLPDAVDFNYDILPDGTARIIGYTGKESHLTVPGEVSGYKVTSIGQSVFAGCSFIREIPETWMSWQTISVSAGNRRIMTPGGG